MSSTSNDNYWRAIAVYRPFLGAMVLVMALTLGFTLLTAHSAATSDNFMRPMNAFMGFFYLTFALPKLSNVRAFAESFAAYDILAKYSKKYALSYPFIELGLGAELLLNNKMSYPLLSRCTIISIVLLSSIGLVSIARALIEQRRIDCACLGSTFSFPLSKVSLMENALMLVMAMGMLFLPMAPMAAIMPAAAHASFLPATLLHDVKLILAGHYKLYT